MKFFLLYISFFFLKSVYALSFYQIETLIQSGNVEQAITALEKYEGHEVGRVRLEALIELKRKNYSKAIALFKLALTKTDQPHNLFTGLMQSLYSSKAYAEVIEFYNQRPKSLNSPSWTLIAAASYQGLSSNSKANELYQEGLKAYPHFSPLIRQYWSFLIDLNLFNVVYNDVTRDLDRFELEDLLYLGALYKQKKQLEKAIYLLELAQLKSPNHANVLAELAHGYYLQGDLHTASRLYTRAARLNLNYSYQAAETYIKLKQFTHARYFNQFVIEENKKVRQMFSIFVSEGNHYKILSLLPALKKINIYGEPQVQYALAFTHFKLGEFKKMESLLGKIESSKLDEKIRQLRQQAQFCRSEGNWKCHV